jgi:hypothetical protein
MQQNLAVVKEIDLKQFIAESKHDGVPGFKPLFNIDKCIVFFELYFILSYLFHFFF